MVMQCVAVEISLQIIFTLEHVHNLKEHNLKKFHCKSSSCICNNNSCKAQISFTVPLYIYLAFYFYSTEYLHMRVGVHCTPSIPVEYRQTLGNGQLGGLSLIVFSATYNSYLLSADISHGQVEVR